MKTLVIIDMQLDFLPGGSLEVPEGDEIIPVINKIQNHFDLIIASQDWHPENHISFASNHNKKNPFEIIEWQGLQQVLWPNHCVQNAQGAMFHPDLEMKKVEAIFRKGMDWQIDSYSAFYDNGHKKNTGLAGYLHERKASDLYFCGLAADFCVRFSILDALKEGFSATVIEDATKPIDKENFLKLKKELSETGCKITNSRSLIG